MEDRCLPNDPFSAGQLSILGAGFAALSLTAMTPVRVLLQGWTTGDEGDANPVAFPLKKSVRFSVGATVVSGYDSFVVSRTRNHHCGRNSVVEC
jgi:hypothetical protein